MVKMCKPLARRRATSVILRRRNSLYIHMPELLFSNVRAESQSISMPTGSRQQILGRCGCLLSELSDVYNVVRTYSILSRKVGVECVLQAQGVIWLECNYSVRRGGVIKKSHKYVALFGLWVNTPSTQDLSSIANFSLGVVLTNFVHHQWQRRTA